MSGLADRALIDVVYYRNSLGIAKDETNLPEEMVDLLITSATDAIEQRCNRTFISPASAADEIFDGTGVMSYIVKQGRIDSATTPVLYYWGGTSWTTATTTTWPRAYENESGEVYFTNGSVFNRGRKNWKIEYKYGWADIADLPADLKRACVDLVEYMRISSKKQGVGSETFGDNSVSYLAGMNKVVAAAWPLTITTVLDKYRVGFYG